MSVRDRERETQRECVRERDRESVRERERDRQRERVRERQRERETERVRDRERQRECVRDRERERERERERQKEIDRLEQIDDVQVKSGRGDKCSRVVRWWDSVAMQRVNPSSSLPPSLLYCFPPSSLYSDSQCSTGYTTLS